MTDHIRLLQICAYAQRFMSPCIICRFWRDPDRSPRSLFWKIISQKSRRGFFSIFYALFHFRFSFMNMKRFAAICRNFSMNAPLFFFSLPASRPQSKRTPETPFPVESACIRAHPSGTRKKLNLIMKRGRLDFPLDFPPLDFPLDSFQNCI